MKSFSFVIGDLCFNTTYNDPNTYEIWRNSPVLENRDRERITLTLNELNLLFTILGAADDCTE